jgi:hypothetical protein
MKAQEGDQMRDPQTLVIDGAAAEKILAYNLGSERGLGPAIARRDDIHMMEQQKSAIQGLIATGVGVEECLPAGRDDPAGRDSVAVEQVAEKGARRECALRSGGVDTNVALEPVGCLHD